MKHKSRYLLQTAEIFKYLYVKTKEKNAKWRIRFEFDHSTKRARASFTKDLLPFLRSRNQTESFILETKSRRRRRRISRGGREIRRTVSGSLSISFQSEIKGRLNADTLRPIDGRVDIAAWKITEGARGCVRRGGRTKKVEDERPKGGSEDERDGRREKRRLAADSTVTERDKGNEPNYPSFLSSSSFRFHPLLPRHSSSFSQVFVQRDAQSIAICRLRDIVGGDIR